MAGLQRHARQVGDVPGRDDVAARVGIAPEVVDDARDLVVVLAAGSLPGPPLPAVDRAELAGGVRPLVPDPHAVLAQVGDVGVAAQEPEQLVDDRADVELLGGEEGKALPQVEPELVAEHAARAHAGTVGLVDAVLQDVAQEIEVSLHRREKRSGAPGPAQPVQSRAAPRLRRGRSCRGCSRRRWSSSPAPAAASAATSRCSPRARGPASSSTISAARSGAKAPMPRRPNRWWRRSNRPTARRSPTTTASPPGTRPRRSSSARSTPSASSTASSTTPASCATSSSTR